ncbi:MAG TPA: TonB-dependent receptor [Hyphomicrobiales bacterium]|nr:TonB-dependent receptor [Hyphomicrobiales bacterium]
MFRQFMKTYGGLVLCSMAMLVTARPVHADEEKQFFDVEEQPVSMALLQIAQQAGVSILFPQGLFADIKSNHLEGRYDLKEALDILLARTNIDVFIVDDTKQIIVSFNDMSDNNKKQVAEEKTETREPQGRRSLLATAIAALFAGGAANAVAQDQSPGQGVLEEVVVTGSRIVRRDLDASSPIMTVDAARLEQSSNLSVEAILNQMPQFTPGQTQFSAQGEIQTSPSTSVGIGSVNLRGVNSNRSLVLIDGRRAQPANASLVVDLNTIPSAAIQRVETITGGASSVYGADALAGVVNFVLKDNFEGASFDLQSGITEVGDAQETRFSSLVGMNSGDGRGNVMLGVEWYERDAAYQKDHDFYKDGWYDPLNRIDTSFPSMPAYAPSSTNRPSQAAVDSLFPQYPPGTISPANTFYFNKDGTAFVRTATGAPGFDESQLNLPDTGDGFYSLIRNQNGTIGQQYMDGAMQSPLQRRSGFGKAHFDINDNVSAFAQVNFSRTEVETFSAGPPPAVGGTRGGSIPNDGRQSIPAGLQTLLDSRPDADDNWQLNRGLDFLGHFGPTNSSDVYQIMAGFEGRFDTLDWTWEAFYSTGETNATNFYTSMPSIERWKLLVASPEFGAGQEILGSGDYRITCDSGLPIFYGTTATTSQNCLDAIKGRWKSLTHLTQDIFEANLQGGLLNLPAGQARFAVGVSNRQNGFKYEPSNPAAAILDTPMGLWVSNPTEGKTEVSEIYGELLIPVLEDVELELGYRLSDYDTKAGKVGTWKALVSWDATDWMRVRGGFQVANRAPNTAELYQSETTLYQSTFASGDPCQVNTFAQGWGNTPDNPNRLKVQELCYALIGSDGTEFGVPGSDEANSFGQGNTTFTGINVVTVGNPDLDSEQAETWTLGLVLQEPLGIEGLTASVDYYNIEITDAIATFSGYEVYQNCFNADGASNPTLSMNDPGGFCSLIQRAETGGVGTVSALYLNTGVIKTSGTDVGANYTTDVPFGGRVSVNSSVSFLHEFVTQTTPTSQEIEYRDTLGNSGQFKYRLNATVGYDFPSADARVGLRLRHLPGVRDATAAVTPNTTILPPGSYTTYDLFGSMTLFDRYQLRGGIDNLFDRDPVIVGARADDRNSASTSPGYYDVLGRRYYVGLRVEF